MSIATVIPAGKGTAGPWRVLPYVGGEHDTADVRGEDCSTLWHYSTAMAVWRRRDWRVLYLSTGHGSVSDQNGLNTLFRQLGSPFRMDRDARGGGPRFRILDGRYSLHATRGGAFQPVLDKLAVAS